MKILRRHLRKMIVNEARRVLSNDALFENTLLNILSSDNIEKEISSVKSQNKVAILDDLVELPEFEKRLSYLDNDKIVMLLSKIRGSVSASTFNKIKATVADHKPELKDELESM